MSCQGLGTPIWVIELTIVYSDTLIEISRTTSVNGATISPEGPMVLLLRIPRAWCPMETSYSAFPSPSIVFIQEEWELSKSYTISYSLVSSTADHNGGRLSSLLVRGDRERHNSVLNSHRKTETGTAFFLCLFSRVSSLLIHLREIVTPQSFGSTLLLQTRPNWHTATSIRL